MADPEPERDREPQGLDEWLAQWTRDPGLRPVLIVVIGSLSAIGAGTVLSGWRGRSLPALAALALLALGSADALLRDWRRRRFGPLSRLVALLWGLSLAGAVLAVRLGLG